MSTTKKQQHYVWSYYLSSWEVKGQLQVYDKKEDKVFCTSSKNIAKEHYFYKMDNINKNDIKIIKSLIKKTRDKQAKEIHSRLWDYFSIISENDIEKLNDKNKKFLINFFEDWHTNIENIGKDYLDSLLDKNLEYFDKNSDSFIHYLFNQLLRTKEQKNSFLKEGCSISGWNIIVMIITHNSALSFVASKKIELLINKTNVDFITSDQPVINIFSEPNEVSTEIKLYYPLSPKIAVTIEQSNQNRFTELNIENNTEIEKYNGKIVKKSYTYIFSKKIGRLL